MKICENCGKEHDGSYGSGRFCCQSCARAFSTKNKRSDINEKVKNTLTERYKETNKYCLICGKKIKNSNRTGFCKDCLNSDNPECIQIRHNIGKTASSHITHFREKKSFVYDENYQAPKNKINYLYKEHNDMEIQKWLNYINSLSFTIPNYEKRQSQTYYVLKEHSTIHKNGTHFVFEHNYLMNIVLKNQLLSTNTVHHIDNNGLNNALSNLMVFETKGDHRRFHGTKFAWLEYNEITHKFICIKK